MKASYFKMCSWCTSVIRLLIVWFGCLPCLVFCLSSLISGSFSPLPCSLQKTSPTYTIFRLLCVSFCWKSAYLDDIFFSCFNKMIAFEVVYLISWPCSFTSCFSKHLNIAVHLNKRSNVQSLFILQNTSLMIRGI